MNDDIKGRGRFHDFVKSTRCGNVGNNAEVELRACSWEIGADLSGFGLRSKDCADEGPTGKQLFENVRAHKPICPGEEYSFSHGRRFSRGLLN